MADESVEPVAGCSTQTEEPASEAAGPSTPEPSQPQVESEPNSPPGPSDNSQISAESQEQDSGTQTQPPNLDWCNRSAETASANPSQAGAAAESPQPAGDNSGGTKPNGQTASESGSGQPPGDDSRYSQVTVQQWGYGKNDCVWNALKGAGYSDREIVEQGLVDRVAKLNGLANPNIVHAGQVLRLPRKGEGVSGGDTETANVAPTAPAPQAVAGNSSIPSHGASPSRPQIGQMLDAAARKYGIPTDYLKAVAYKESTWSNRAVGDGGYSHGIMQIYSSAHPDYNVRRGQQDASYNVDYGAQFLSNLYRQTGNWHTAIRRYNGAGPRAEAYAASVWRLAQQRPWTQWGVA